MQLDGTSAMVTGGASGLGEATARMLAASGARVGVIDVDADRAQMVAEEIGGVAVAADVASEGDMTTALQGIVSAHGAPRIVVSCAGIGTAARVVGRDGPMPLDSFERVIRVNLVGTFNVMRLAAAAMQELDPMADGERGAFVHTASVAAFEGQIGQVAYSASKGGIVAMTLPAAREFARLGIRVNVVAPGIFLTPLLHTLPEDAQKALAANIPFPGRLGDPSEFADTVRFCVENRYLNGETIRLDGASRLQPK
ncbi:SDR family NAD(P)-dependent oxidoreductase [Algicella marina]|uniref:SDR family oxidoreductase n=1 Tax=Algicella marina TaxID=2683284 RepID=A0A6P1SYF9_9RHOB|nr:SDR family NAD(P)-dependent oxidoreductase [Algicella marina]QHQ34393.1 SDR family oxidoreductase [Algicella marina]